MSTEDLIAAAEMLRNLPEPELPPWPPAPLDAIPEPRPVPGHPHLAVIDGTGDRPLGEHDHHHMNDQHDPPDHPRTPHRGGDQAGKGA